MWPWHIPTIDARPNRGEMAQVIVAAERLEDRTMMNAPTQWTSRGVGGGGAFFAPSFSPFDSKTLYVTSDMSGLYRSTDQGKSWAITDFRQIQAGRWSRVQFTNNPAVLYSIDTTNDGAVPSRSNDTGKTWHHLAGWNAADQAFGQWVDPANGNHIAVATYGSLFFSSDGGQTFKAKFTTTNNGQGLYVAGVFFDGNNIFVCTCDGLLDSSDGGTSFKVATLTGVPTGSNYLSFAGAKQNGITRFFAVTARNGDIFAGLNIETVPAGSFSGVWTIDWGKSTQWAKHTTGIPANEYPAFVSMARNNISVAYLGGTDGNSNPVVLKTTNAAGAWADVLHVANNKNIYTGWQGAGGDRQWSFSQETLDFQVNPVDPNTVAFTDFGYVHITSDGGNTWHQAYLNPADQNPINQPTPQHKTYHGVGLEDTSTLWLGWTDAKTMIAGYTDIYGTRSTDGGQSWSFPTNISLAGNTLYQVSALPTKSVPSGVILYGATSNTHDIYQSTHIIDSRIDRGTGSIIFSIDKGASWKTLHAFGHPVIYTALDPTDANRMYASVVSSTAGGIYVTNDLNNGANSVWTRLTNPPRTEGHPYNIHVLKDGTIVATFSARRISKFTASSGVFVSTDHGKTWADRTDAGMMYWTKDLTVDPTDPTQNTWYAAVRSAWGGNGNGMGGLYKTVNRGKTWTKIFATDSVESVTVNASNGEMYVSTLLSGLWYCPSVHAAKLAFTQTTYPFRQPERVFINPFNPKDIWITSFGYGLVEATG